MLYYKVKSVKKGLEKLPKLVAPEPPEEVNFKFNDAQFDRIDGTMIEDHLVFMVRNGRLRPNTPIAISYAKDDAWTFTGEAWEFMRDVLFNPLSLQIEADQSSTGFSVPAPWPHTMFDQMYQPAEAAALKQAFECVDGTDCIEGFSRWVQATHWYCNTRWAFNGVMKSDPSTYGPV